MNLIKFGEANNHEILGNIAVITACFLVVVFFGMLNCNCCGASSEATPTIPAPAKKEEVKIATPVASTRATTPSKESKSRSTTPSKAKSPVTKSPAAKSPAKSPKRAESPAPAKSKATPSKSRAATPSKKASGASKKSAATDRDDARAGSLMTPDGVRRSSRRL